MDIIRRHPFKPFDEQLKEIELKNITIDDYELANEAIRSFSYYSIINGYKDLFLDKRRTTASQEKCLPGTTFSMIYTVHWMDITLSGILFKYTLAVEKKLKTQVANLVAELYSIEETDYLDKKCYSQAKHHRGKLAELIAKIDEAKRRDISAIHYYESEKNLPPWIAAKAISFGSTVTWYSMLKENDKNSIISQFLSKNNTLSLQERLDFFDSMLDQVYQFRNLTAHGNRSFSLELPKPVKLLFLRKIHLDSYFSENELHHKNDLHSLIICLMILINDKFVVLNMISELESYFTFYSKPEFIFANKNVYQLFNLPDDIVERLKTFYDFKFQ